MPTLKNYINRKCEDASFRKMYEESCEICPVTVALIDRMYRMGLSREETALKAGVSIRELTDIEEAEKCSYDVAANLCRALGLPEPADCRKKNKA